MEPKASLAWRQEHRISWSYVRSASPTRIYERNPVATYSMPSAVAACRLPGGHPEAFFEAFANIYRDAFADMRRLGRGKPSSVVICIPRSKMATTASGS